MDAVTRECQIDAAWLRHEPRRSRVTPEARRAVAAFKRQIDGDADRVKAALMRVSSLILDWTKKGPRGRERKLPPIKDALRPAECMIMDAELLVL